MSQKVKTKKHIIIHEVITYILHDFISNSLLTKYNSYKENAFFFSLFKAVQCFSSLTFFKMENDEISHTMFVLKGKHGVHVHSTDIFDETPFSA